MPVCPMYYHYKNRYTSHDVVCNESIYLYSSTKTIFIQCYVCIDEFGCLNFRCKYLYKIAIFAIENIFFTYDIFMYYKIVMIVIFRL